MIVTRLQNRRAGVVCASIDSGISPVVETQTHSASRSLSGPRYGGKPDQVDRPVPLVVPVERGPGRDSRSGAAETRVERLVAESDLPEDGLDVRRNVGA